MPADTPVLDLGSDGKYTYEELQAAYVAIRDNWKKFKKFIRPATLHFLENNGRMGEDIAHYIADYLHDEEEQSLFGSERSHIAFGNDLFYLAHRYNLGRHGLEKKRAAIVVVWNGRHAYFEWLTHHGGYDNARLFAEMGVISQKEADHYRAMAKDPKSGMYCFIEKPVEDRLVTKLRLSESDVGSAPLLCHNIWEKMQTNNYSSGQYSRLPLRPDLGRESEYTWY